MRRTTTLLAVSTAVAITLTGLASAGTAAPSTTVSNSQTLRYTQQFGSGFGLDLGQAGPSGGDVFGGSAIWVKGTKTVAQVGFTCTATNLQPPEDLCILSARFANGVLTAQTLFDEQSSAPTDYAITGGSHAFRDAAGYLTVTNGASDITIYLDNHR
jgi:hypothetical protein